MANVMCKGHKTCRTYSAIIHLLEGILSTYVCAGSLSPSLLFPEVAYKISWYVNTTTSVHQVLPGMCLCAHALSFYSSDPQLTHKCTYFSAALHTLSFLLSWVLGWWELCVFSQVRREQMQLNLEIAATVLKLYKAINGDYSNRWTHIYTHTGWKSISL